MTTPLPPWALVLREWRGLRGANWVREGACTWNILSCSRSMQGHEMHQTLVLIAAAVFDGWLGRLLSR